MDILNSEQCPKCGNFNNRGITIDAVIVNDNKILIIKRKSDPFKNFWALPGGYVEWNESVEEAVIREVREETDVIVKTIKLIGVYSAPNRHPKQVIDIAYAATISGIPKAGDDAMGYKWFLLNDLPAELAFDHQIIINDYLASLKK